MTALPVVDLADFLRPSALATEWVYGPARTDWLRSHPITAYADGDAGEPFVELRGPLGLSRDELPHLAAWLLAVHAATKPEDANPQDMHRVVDSGLPDLVDVEGDHWFWGRDDLGNVGYVCISDDEVMYARTRAELDEEYGPLKEQAQPRQAGAA